MDVDMILYLGRHTMETALLLSLPILLVCVVAGVVISLFQTVTSIRDMSLTIAPKLIAVGITSLLFGNWMLQMLMKFTTEIFSRKSSKNTDLRSGSAVCFSSDPKGRFRRIIRDGYSRLRKNFQGTGSLSRGFRPRKGISETFSMRFVQKHFRRVIFLIPARLRKRFCSAPPHIVPVRKSSGTRKTFRP